MNKKETDQVRRQEFIKYFNEILNSDRQKLIDSGISKGRITQYLDPEEPFGEKAATGIEDRLNVDRGAIFPSLLPPIPEAAKLLSSKIPVVGRAKLGDENCFFSDLEYPVGNGDGFIQWPTKDQNAYALLCIGDSMNPRIKHGEFVVIEPNREVHPGDEVVVKDANDRVMVKQFAYQRSGLNYFVSVNENYAPFSLDPSEIKLMHYVAGIAKPSLWIDK